MVKVNSKKKNKAIHFVAAIEGIKFSKAQLRNIELKINEAVIAEIAQIDFKGDLSISNDVGRLAKDLKLKIGTRGLIYRNKLR